MKTIAGHGPFPRGAIQKYSIFLDGSLPAAIVSWCSA
jgi:hypothetical protein